MSENLLPCPFCGGVAAYIGYKGNIYCAKCSLKINGIERWKKEAVKRYNQKTYPKEPKTGFE